MGAGGSASALPPAAGSASFTAAAPAFPPHLPSASSSSSSSAMGPSARPTLDAPSIDTQGLLRRAGQTPLRALSRGGALFDVAAAGGKGWIAAPAPPPLAAASRAAGGAAPPAPSAIATGGSTASPAAGAAAAAAAPTADAASSHQHHHPHASAAAAAAKGVAAAALRGAAAAAAAAARVIPFHGHHLPPPPPPKPQPSLSFLPDAEARIFRQLPDPAAVAFARGGRAPPPPPPPPKPTDLGTAWLLLRPDGSPATRVAVDRLALGAALRLAPRDVRLLDPLVAASYPSAVLARGAALLLRLEHVQAIVTRGWCLLAVSFSFWFLVFGF